MKVGRSSTRRPGSCYNPRVQNNLPSLKPVPLGRQDLPFDHPDWLFEIRFDGFRALAYFFDDKCRLLSRKGNTYSSRVLNEVSAGIAANLNAKNAVVDGELCCLGADGRSMFNVLLGRKRSVYFTDFDFLLLN